MKNCIIRNHGVVSNEYMECTGKPVSMQELVRHIVNVWHETGGNDWAIYNTGYCPYHNIKGELIGVADEVYCYDPETEDYTLFSGYNFYYFSRPQREVLKRAAALYA